MRLASVGLGKIQRCAGCIVMLAIDWHVNWEDSHEAVERFANTLQTGIALRPLVYSLEVRFMSPSEDSLHEAIRQIISCTSLKRLHLQLDDLDVLLAALPRNLDQLDLLEICLDLSPLKLTRLLRKFPSHTPALRSLYFECSLTEADDEDEDEAEAEDEEGGRTSALAPVTPLAHQVSNLGLYDYGPATSHLLDFFTVQPASLLNLKIGFHPRALFVQPQTVVALAHFVNLVSFEVDWPAAYGMDPAIMVRHIARQVANTTALTTLKHFSVILPVSNDRSEANPSIVKKAGVAFAETEMWKSLPLSLQRFSIRGLVLPETVTQIISDERLNLKVLEIDYHNLSELEELELDGPSQTRRDLDALASKRGVDLRISPRSQDGSFCCL